ncbi:MAG: SurA N-terminal domain-containing protein [Coriobacteriia bacterium]|nr:SurA N-terminal domain-containing protein [Coriobacteriia bacterium]
MAEKMEGKRRKKAAAVVAVALVAVVCAAVAGAFAMGVLAPPDAAAKYGDFEYVTEPEVTEYIQTYKEQMGYGKASDEEWATFLAAYNMTPERLRASTIDQLVTDKLVKKRCDELGIAVTDEEVDQYEQSYKDAYASGSDKIWAQNMAQYGQTEEGFRAGARLTLQKQKLCEAEVKTPEVTDDQVKQTIATCIDARIASEQSLTLKHTYCFRKSKSSKAGSLKEREEVQKIRDGLLAVGPSEESFASIVELYSDDAALKERAGSNGWNVDVSTYSQEYVSALEKLGDGDVSPVLADDDGYYFLWVSHTYALPKDSDKAAKINLDKMPEALRSYFRDCAAYEQWQNASKEYLATITSGVNVIYYDMPADVPYNVDMGLAKAPEEVTR